MDRSAGNLSDEPGRAFRRMLTGAAPETKPHRRHHVEPSPSLNYLPFLCTTKGTIQTGWTDLKIRARKECISLLVLHPLVILLNVYGAALRAFADALSCRTKPFLLSSYEPSPWHNWRRSWNSLQQ
jgi:hypothetical protein